MSTDRSRRVTAWGLACVTVLLPHLAVPRPATAMPFDQETGLYYANARMYHPRLGRFLQRDPNGTGLVHVQALLRNGQIAAARAMMDPLAQFRDGMNPYQYARSNPITHRDPSGLFSLMEVGARAGAYGAMAGGTLGWMHSYANYADEGSQWRQATAFFMGAGVGTFTGIAMGLTAGAIGAAAGSLSVGITAVGLMTSPTALGLAVAENMDAETYGERLMAKIDLGFAGIGVLTSHTAAFRLTATGTLGGARGYPSFVALKQELGPAGPGKAWHHIVEKHATNVSAFGPEAIHNTRNVIRLPHGPGSVHEKISAHYSSIRRASGNLTVRQWLSTKSFEEQYDYGLKTLREHGVDTNQIGK